MVRDDATGGPAGLASVTAPAATQRHDLPLAVLRDHLVPAEPPELELGVVELEDGAACLATVLRPSFADSPELTDITSVGDWRAYLASR